MDKSFAIFCLGGTAPEAARWIGVSSEVLLREWPDKLHPVMVDRVIAAHIRRELASALGQSAKTFFADWRNEALIEKMMKNISGALVMLSLMPRIPPEFARRENTEAANEPIKKRTPGRPRLRPADTPQAAAVAG